MNTDVRCSKHSVGPEDVEWKVALEEMTQHERRPEPFRGQVCPVCYMRMRDTLKDVKRRLKVESRHAVMLRTRSDQLQETVDAVIEVVKTMTGDDAKALAEREYRRHEPSAELFGDMEPGMLKNILPNLVAQAISKKENRDD